MYTESLIHHLVLSKHSINYWKQHLKQRIKLDVPIIPVLGKVKKRVIGELQISWAQWWVWSQHGLLYMAAAATKIKELNVTSYEVVVYYPVGRCTQNQLFCSAFVSKESQPQSTVYISAQAGRFTSLRLHKASQYEQLPFSLLFFPNLQFPRETARNITGRAKRFLLCRL